MDQPFAGNRAGVYLFFAVIVAGALWCQHAAAEQLQQARVTQVFNNVKLLPTQAAARPAVVNDEVKQGTAVRTGTDSRTELTFTDLTITRLGANTVFSFKPGTREVKVDNGAILIQIPPGAPEAKVSTAAVSAAISGGTAIFDAPTGKFMILEGIGRFWLTGHPEHSTVVHAGEIVWRTRGGQISRPKTVNVKRLMQTSRLITGFGTLPNADLIEQVIALQEGDGDSTNPLDKTNMEIISQRYAIPTPSPGPSGESEFGSPPTISSPNPYGIGPDTTITTDPIVTTSGVTDRGTVYRGPSIDGPYSTWAFGSTSPFDSSSGFNALMDHRSSALKFAALELSGDPTVVIIDDKTSLALIGVNGITSTEPGGVLSFGGIPELLLATQNGPITLGPEVSFNVHELTMYARGAESDLTLGSNIFASESLRLLAQHNLEITSAFEAPAIDLIAGNNITVGLFDTDQIAQTDGHILVQAGNNIAATDAIAINRTAAPGSSNVDVTFDAGADLTVGSGFLGNGFSIAINNSAGVNSLSGAAIMVNAGGNIIVNGAPGFSTMIDNSGANLLAGDALIGVSSSSLIIGGNFSNIINNQGGSVIFGSAVISTNVSGDILTGGNSVFQILNSGSLIGQVGGSASIDIAAANVNVNALLAEIDSGNGGSIGSPASINVNVSGTVTTNGDTTVQIATSAGTTGHGININGGAYEAFGTFLAAMRGGDGTITLNAASVHADTIKVGALGANGVLNIGSGLLSADTLLKLYAGGSNGTINFNQSVTLNGNSAKIIAANTINIFDGVVLTINGPVPASIYTNNPNYAVASGGNGTHSGTIAGTAGASAPQPLANAPAFDASATSSSSVSGTTTAITVPKRSKKRIAERRSRTPTLKTPSRHDRVGRRGAIRVANTDQLRDLIENGTPRLAAATRTGAKRDKSLRDGSDRQGKRLTGGLLREPSPRSNELATRLPLR